MPDIEGGENTLIRGYLGVQGNQLILNTVPNFKIPIFFLSPYPPDSKCILVNAILLCDRWKINQTRCVGLFQQNASEVKAVQKSV